MILDSTLIYGDNNNLCAASVSGLMGKVKGEEGHETIRMRQEKSFMNTLNPPSQL